jgi:DNA-binding protein HU-beta
MNGRRDFRRKIALFLLTGVAEALLDGISAQAAIPRYRGSGSMNKQELIGSVAETTGLSRSDASKAVEGVFDAIGNALKRGDEVRLVGFGTFSCSKRKASTGRNPRTGEPMQIKESTQPKFKAGKGLKDSVNV